MYVAVVPNRGSPPAILLRESYREAGKTKNRTLANLSRWPAERIEQLRAVGRIERRRFCHLKRARLQGSGPTPHVLTRQRVGRVVFSKMAVVTFGGAYAVLAYMAQHDQRKRHPEEEDANEREARE